MTELIRSQIGVIIVMTYCGMTAALIYDFFTLFIERFIKKSRTCKAAVRVLGYVVIGILTADFAMYCQNGKVSFMALVCFAFGLWLWNRFFYDIMNAKEQNNVKNTLNVGEDNE